MTNGNFDVAVLVGSLRKESFNLKLAKAMQRLAPQNLKLQIIEIRDLPLYNEDLEASAPAAWSTFREQVRPTDAVLFVTPEYNRSGPGVLKNAIDVGSRPAGKSVWSGKPAAVMSVTPFKLGAFRANHALRQTFVFLDMPALQQPELYISNAAELLAEDGSLRNEDTKKLLTKFRTTFDAWIAKTDAAG